MQLSDTALYKLSAVPLPDAYALLESVADQGDRDAIHAATSQRLVTICLEAVKAKVMVKEGKGKIRCTGPAKWATRRRRMEKETHTHTHSVPSGESNTHTHTLGARERHSIGQAVCSSAWLPA